MKSMFLLDGDLDLDLVPFDSRNHLLSAFPVHTGGEVAKLSKWRV